MATATKQKAKARKPRLPTKAEIAVRHIQFSKKLTVYVMVFWGVYRLAQLAAVIIRPEVATSLVQFSSGVDTVAIAFGLTYTTNSIAEKSLQTHKDVQKYMYLGTEKEDKSEEDSDDNG